MTEYKVDLGKFSKCRGVIGLTEVLLLAIAERLEALVEVTKGANGCDCSERHRIGATVGGSQLYACNKCLRVYVMEK